jgi:Uma2 family endonuclease
MYQNNPIVPANTLPTMYDLPSEDPEEMGLPSAEGVSLEVSSSARPARDEFHDFQPDLLRETCHPNTNEFFIGADLNLYYDSRHTGWYKRPDWFLVQSRSTATTYRAS